MRGAVVSIVLLVLVVGCTSPSAPTAPPAATATPAASPTAAPAATPTVLPSTTAVVTAPVPTASPTVTAAPSMPPAAVLEGELATAGTLTVCFALLGPPSSELDENGEPFGYNVSFANELANRVDLPLTFQQTLFADLIEQVESHACDLAVSSQNITAERLLRVDFVDYTETKAPGLVAIGNPAGIDSLDDLCGLAASAITGTTQVDLVHGEGQYVGQGLNAACTAASQPEIDLRTFEEDLDALQALLDGEVDFYMGNPNHPRDYPNQIEQSRATLPETRQGFTVAKDHPVLFTAVNAAMAEMIEDGTYTAILREHFPTGSLSNVSIIE